MDYLLICLIIAAITYAATDSSPEDPTAMPTPIDRLKEKFAKARGVAQRIASDMEAEADNLIAEEDKMRAATREAFAPHKAILAEAQSELSAIKDALNIMSNGGPPLTDAESTSPESPAVDPAPPVTQPTAPVPPITRPFDHATGDPLR